MMETLNQFDVVEILKAGIAGLIFLLSLFSFKLLHAEQKKESPNSDILSSIRYYMKINIVFVVVTILSTAVDNLLKMNGDRQSALDTNITFTIRQYNNTLQSRFALVCNDSQFNNRYILLTHMVDGQIKTIEVFAKPGMASCAGENILALNAGDLGELGLTSISEDLAISGTVALPGTKFQAVVPG